MARKKASREWRLTELFVLLHKDATAALARHDPVGLTRMGAPLDEYDAEAGQVVRRLIGEARNPADVERIAGDVFEHYFNERYDGVLEEFATELWQRYEELRTDERWNAEAH